MALFVLSSCSEEGQIVIPLSKWEKVRSGKKVNMTLEEVVEKDWVNNLLDLPKIYPEGDISRGNEEKGISASFSFPVLLTDLNQTADFSFHQTESDIEQPRQYRYPARLLFIKTESQEMSNKLVLAIKDKLKAYFPKGGPSIRDSQEIGYVILNNENCGDIRVEWATVMLGESNTVRLAIQCFRPFVL